MKRYPMKLVMPLDDNMLTDLMLALSTREAHLNTAEDVNTPYVQNQLKFLLDFQEDLHELKSPRHMVPAYNLLSKESKHG